MRTLREEAARKIEHPITGDEVELGEHDRTLGQILGHKEEQELFLNRYLFTRDPVLAQEVTQSLESGTPFSPEQSKKLEKGRKEYNAERKRIELLSELLTADELRNVAQSNQRFAELVGKVGAEEAADLMRTQFQEFALANPSVLKRIEGRFQKINDIGESKRAKRVFRKLDTMLGRYGMSEEEFASATRGSLKDDEKKEALREKAAEQYGWFRTSVDFVTGHALSKRRGRRLFNNFEEQQKLLAECDKHRKVIGNFLQSTITPDIDAAIQKQILEGGSLMKKIEQENTDTIVSVQDYKKMKEESDPSPAAVVARYEAYEKEECKRRKIADISKQPALRDSLKEEFAKREVAQRRKYKGRGVFGILLMLLFGSTPATKDDIKSLLP